MIEAGKFAYDLSLSKNLDELGRNGAKKAGSMIGGFVGGYVGGIPGFVGGGFVGETIYDNTDNIEESILENVSPYL